MQDATSGQHKIAHCQLEDSVSGSDSKPLCV